MQFDRNFVEELKARVKLSDVIGRKLRLIRRGREFVALSPFSNEKSPSFTINDDKGFYHCFSTGKHGDAITFLMETESLSFQEAVAKLAADLGMEMPKPRFGDNDRDRAAQSRRGALYGVMQQAAAFFTAQLNGPSGAGARAYLERRQVPPALREKMGLGFAPATRTLLCDALTRAGVTPELLVEAGLAIKPDNGGAIYDRFRDRIMFPITDNSDRVIAFGGRAMSADAQAKYLNSPETPLFHKGGVLYNLANARRALAAPGKGQGRDSLIVAEGYMDVIALTRAGFANAVAPLGTALTETQMAMLWRIAPEPVLCFDGDAAGVRAMQRVVERALPLLEPGRSLRFVKLEGGQDPDDVVAREGAAAMAEYLAKPSSLADVLWSEEISRLPLDTPERRAGLESRLNVLLATIADPAVRKHYQNDIRQRLFDLFRPAPRPAHAVERDSMRFKGRRPQAPLAGIGPASAELKKSPLATAGTAWNAGLRRERLIIQTVLHHPALLERHLEAFSELTLADPGLDSLRTVIIELAAAYPDLETGSLRSHLVGRGYGAIINDMPPVGIHSGDWFCGPEAAFADAETGWLLTVQRHCGEIYQEQGRKEAEQALAADSPLEEKERQLINLQRLVAEDAQEGTAIDFGEASGKTAHH